MAVATTSSIMGGRDQNKSINLNNFVLISQIRNDKTTVATTQTAVVTTLRHNNSDSNTF